jgi:DNA-binding IclR family transcriptional regulator
VSAAKPTSEEAVVKALASGTELTGVEIATATGLGRSTVGKALAALKRAGAVRRHAGGRDGRRRLPDRWSIDPTDKNDVPARAATQRLRPGQLDRLVLDYIDSQGKGTAVGAAAVANALGRSTGAVGNCLTRLAAAGRVRQVNDKPRRYSSGAASTTSDRPRKEGS